MSNVFEKENTWFKVRPWRCNWLQLHCSAVQCTAVYYCTVLHCLPSIDRKLYSFSCCEQPLGTAVLCSTVQTALGWAGKYSAQGGTGAELTLHCTPVAAVEKSWHLIFSSLYSKSNLHLTSSLLTWKKEMYKD